MEGRGKGRIHDNIWIRDLIIKQKRKKKEKKREKNIGKGVGYTDEMEPEKQDYKSLYTPIIIRKSKTINHVKLR